MSAESNNAYLLGKILITGEIEVKTGLRIGGTTAGIKIGGVDLNVIIDPMGKPYIPGSSLKGKLRNLLERKEKVKWNKLDKNNRPIGHQCKNDTDYSRCAICKIFGLSGGKDLKSATMTRLIVRDIYLDESSITKEMQDNMEFEWTEVKFETAINRITGTALDGSLRQAERVPPGAVFKDCEMIYNVYEESDKDMVKKVFEAMELLEHDYLGGMGSRGYGKIAFKGIKVFWNKAEDYESGNISLTENRKINGNLDTPAKLVNKFDELRTKLNS